MRAAPDELLRLHGSPLLVLDRARLRRAYRAYRRRLPRVRPYYAVAANPHPDVLGTFAALGSGFAVATEAELRLVLAEGVAPERILLAGGALSFEALQVARRAGVDLVGLGCEAEAHKIAKAHPGCRVLARCPFDTPASEVVSWLLRAEALGLRPVGVACGVERPALLGAGGLLAEAKRRRLTLTTVVLGDGWPARRDLDRFLPDALLLGEPGGHLVAAAGRLLTRVVGRSWRAGRPLYHLDAGVSSGLGPVRAAAHRFTVRTARTGPTRPSLLAGPAGDLVAEGVELPELAVGDLLSVAGLGATAGTAMVGGLAPAKVLVL